MQADQRLQVRQLHREERGREVARDPRPEAVQGRARTPQVNLQPLHEQRPEKPKPLQVVEVEVRQQQVDSGGRVRRQLRPQGPDAGPGIENDHGAVVEADLDARGVAAVAHGEGAWAWDRAPRAPELHPQAHLVSLDTRHDSTSGLRLERRAVTSVM